jgi:two-component system LytT family sensor kinase
MNRSKWLIVFFVWEIVGLGASLAFSLTKEDFHVFVHYLILGLTITNTIGLLGTIFFIAYQKTLGQRIRQRFVHVLFAILITAIVVLGGAEIALFLANRVCTLAIFHTVDQRHILSLIVNIIFAALIAGTNLIFFIAEKSKADIMKIIGETESLKRLQIESKLAILETRLNPHFLFNTLNAMLSMVYDNPRKLENLILNLSAIYRKVLATPENVFITLDEELRLVREYLEVEKFRLTDKLDFEISAEERVISYKIPPFIIENVVENAVNHSIFPKSKGGKIFIGVHRVAETVFIHIRENGVGFMRESESEGFGIFNIRQLLKLAYGDNAKFSTTSLPGGGTQVSMELPWENIRQLAEQTERPESLFEEKIS